MVDTKKYRQSLAEAGFRYATLMIHDSDRDLLIAIGDTMRGKRMVQMYLTGTDADLTHLATRYTKPLTSNRTWETIKNSELITERWQVDMIAEVEQYRKQAVTASEAADKLTDGQRMSREGVEVIAERNAYIYLANAMLGEFAVRLSREASVKNSGAPQGEWIVEAENAA